MIPISTPFLSMSMGKRKGGKLYFGAVIFSKPDTLGSRGRERTGEITDLAV
jgi:hypothetical protein